MDTNESGCILSEMAKNTSNKRTLLGFQKAFATSSTKLQHYPREISVLVIALV